MVFRFKNIAFWFFVLLATTLAVYAYISLKKSKRPDVSAISLLPDSCSVYLSTGNFFELNERIRSKSVIADKLRLFGEVEDMVQALGVYDSLFNSNNALKEILGGTAVHLALYNRPNGWLAVFNLTQLGTQNEINEALITLFKARQEKNSVYSFTTPGKQTGYFSLNSGVVIFSDKQVLIESAVQSKQAKFINSKPYKDFLATLHETSLLNIFINHRLYTTSHHASRLNLSVYSQKGYTAVQFEIEASKIKANGFLIPDSSEVISRLFNEKGQAPEEFLSILPQNLESFSAYGFESYSRVKSTVSQRVSLNEVFWKMVNDTAMFNLEKEFESNTGNHLLSFETEGNRSYCAVQVKDTVRALEHLRLMSDTAIVESGKFIFELTKVNGPLRLFSPFLENTTGYALLNGSFLIFSDNKNELINLMVNQGQTVTAGGNEGFNNYGRQNFPDAYNYLYYSSPAISGSRTRAFFNFKQNENTNPYAELRHFSFSLLNDANAFKLRFHLQNEAESKGQEGNVLWTLNLDTVSTMTPATFVNHNSGENEILIQDEATNLYLLNAKGTLVWKKNIGEKIMSEIHMVDVFKNGKFQMLFNTKNHIYMLDRNGHHVKGYPVDLPAMASSPISLLDYDHDKDYRIFVSCSDLRIYNYNAQGQAQDGFVPVKTEHEVNLPLQYVKVGKSDYLVALDKEGKIYTFSRKGVGRIGLKNRSLANCRAFYVDATNNVSTTNFICVDDKSAYINKISFTDKRELVHLNMEQGNSEMTFVLIDDNRDMDILLTNGNSFLAYNFNGDLLMEKKMTEGLGQTGYFGDESLDLYYSLNASKTELIVYNAFTQKSRKLRCTALPLVSNLFKNNKKYFVLTQEKQISCVSAY